MALSSTLLILYAQDMLVIANPGESAVEYLLAAQPSATSQLMTTSQDCQVHTFSSRVNSLVE